MMRDVPLKECTEGVKAQKSEIEVTVISKLLLQCFAGV